jgi:hypothetical protein
MKQLLWYVVFFFFGLSIFAQETEEKNHHEIKWNALYAAVGAISLEYEYIFDDNMSVGALTFLSLASSENSEIRSMGGLFFRTYIGKKRANGFFIDVNSVIAHIKKETTYQYSDNHFGLGLALGGKFLLKNNFTIEGFFGGGLLNNSKSDNVIGFPDVYPRLGVSIGKRF